MAEEVQPNLSDLQFFMKVKHSEAVVFELQPNKHSGINKIK